MADRGDGRLEAIWIKRSKRGPMDPRSRVRTIAGSGLERNADQGGKRQVTVLSREAWRDAAAAAGASDLDPGLRRANLFVSGLDLAESRGRTLRVGTTRIRIRGETVPCGRMDEGHDGLREALRPAWRGGAYGEVLDDGEVAVGDAARWEPEGSSNQPSS